MELQHFARMVQQRGAQQLILAAEQPLRILIEGRWEQGSHFTPSEHALNGMLRACVPSNLLDGLTQDTGVFSFPYKTVTGEFLVEVQTVFGARTVTLTNLSLSTGGSALPPATPPTPPPSIAPALDLDPAPPATSTTPSEPPGSVPESGLSVRAPSSRLSATTSRPVPQIANEIARGAVNALPPPMPSAVPPVTPAEISPAGAAPPPFPQVSPSAEESSPAGTTAPVTWYHSATGSPTGPITPANMKHCIQTNIVRPDTMVWREGMPDWTMAKLTELEPLFAELHPSSKAASTEIYGENTSGRHQSLPSELRGFNWGAALLPVFWSIAHGAWPICVAFLLLGAGMAVRPLLWFLMIAGQVALGVVGNEIAWRYRRFESSYEFNEIQNVWGRYGLGVNLALLFLAVIVVALMQSYSY